MKEKAVRVYFKFKDGGFSPNTEYTGSFIDGTFDDLNVSNKS
jgi:hypothetical protein